MEPKKQAIVLGVAWFILGGVLYAGVAGISIFGGAYVQEAAPPEFDAALGFILCGLPFPMLFGWAPAAYRLAAGRPGPWISAVVMGAIAIILPIASLIFLANTL